MNRQTQSDDFPLVTHRLAAARRHEDPQRIGAARDLLARRRAADCVRVMLKEKLIDILTLDQPISLLDSQRFATDTIRARARRRAVQALAA